MVARSRRRSAWILLAVLAVGFAAMAGSASADSMACCPEAPASERPDESQPCQWMIPGPCCDAALAVHATASTAPPAPAACFGAPGRPVLTCSSRISDPPDFQPPERVALATVVLRL